jgi:arsenate reductase
VSDAGASSGRAGEERPIRVLFVCTGNSARSVMAEALLRRVGGDRFLVSSAGTEPKGINPLTLRVLAEIGIDAAWARSESVTAYLGQSFDYVITVCNQAQESCPVFPGVHRSLHWDFEDPAAAEGTEEERLAVFRRVLVLIEERIDAFAALALVADLDPGDVDAAHAEAVRSRT